MNQKKHKTLKNKFEIKKIKNNKTTIKPLY
jgi:hypothetical protein